MSHVHCENVTLHGCEITWVTINQRKQIEGIFIEFEEPLDDGYVKVKGEIWFNQESGAYIGYPIYLTDPYNLQGGGYFGR